MYAVGFRFLLYAFYRAMLRRARYCRAKSNQIKSNLLKAEGPDGH